MMNATNRSWTVRGKTHTVRHFEAAPAVQMAAAAHEMAPAPAVPGPGITDHGFADSDVTSQWIVAHGEKPYV